MLGLFDLLLGWLPVTLHVYATGAFIIFTIVVLLRIVAFIKDLIPFL